MRPLTFAVTAAAGLLALTACAGLGKRSTLAELDARCDARGGELVPGRSAAEGGYRCDQATVNAAATSADAGGLRAASQMSGAVDRAMRQP